MGIGNTMRGDDALGPLIIDKLYEKLSTIDKNTDNIYLLNAATAPENHTIEVRKIQPSHIIIVDAVEFDAEDGTFLIIDKNQIDTFNFSTHSMPLSFLINYIEEYIHSQIMTIGIKPKDMTRVNTVSAEIEESMNELVDYIVGII